MKTLDLSAYGVSEMTKQEMGETDGGFLGLLALVGLVLLASCGTRGSIKIEGEVSWGNEAAQDTIN
jgi:hypothetical protein